MKQHKMFVRPLLLLLTMILLHAGLCQAQAAPLEAALEQRLQAAAHAVHSLQSRFVQYKYLSMFSETLVSKGRFYFQHPDRLRWEMTEPVASGFVLDGPSGRRWHEHVVTSEPFELEQDPAMRIVANQLLAWARSDLNWLKRHYLIEVTQSQPVCLRLTPLEEGAARFLDHLEIVFSADDRYVAAVTLYEGDGDHTEIRFEETRVNPDLSTALFQEP
ncbi:MAG: outer membrane lipoprotein carrier protein LolA [Desulfuromonadaceae bacterium]|nr:outer membrane lipoprotein carrier protein LolA [Desulfuromonadaceae bacterium]